MTSIKFIFTLFLFLSGTKIISAQDSLYAVAVNSNGNPVKNKISLDQLHSLNALNILSKEGSQVKKISVASFKITLIERGKEPRDFDCHSEILNNNIKEEIKKIKGRAKIYFEYIKAAMPDSTFRAVNPLALEVE